MRLRLSRCAHQRELLDQLTRRQRSTEGHAAFVVAGTRAPRKTSRRTTEENRRAAPACRRTVSGEAATADGAGALQEGHLRSAGGSPEHEPAGADAAGIR